MARNEDVTAAFNETKIALLKAIAKGVQEIEEQERYAVFEHSGHLKNLAEAFRLATVLPGAGQSSR